MSRRKSREERVDAGNPSRRPLPEPVLIGSRQVETPQPPARLSPEVAEVWRAFAEILTDAGYLVQGDLMLLERLAFTVAHTHRVEAELEDAPLVVEGTKAAAIVNPLYKLHRDLTAQAQRLAGAFGLSPSDRAKLGYTVAAGATIARRLRESDEIVTLDGTYSKQELIRGTK
jgi:P27 family predicted phage terminase small subunit